MLGTMSCASSHGGSDDKGALKLAAGHEIGLCSMVDDCIGHKSHEICIHYFDDRPFPQHGCAYRHT